MICDCLKKAAHGYLTFACVNPHSKFYSIKTQRSCLLLRHITQSKYRTKIRSIVNNENEISQIQNEISQSHSEISQALSEISQTLSEISFYFSHRCDLELTKFRTKIREISRQNKARNETKSRDVSFEHYCRCKR